MRSIVPALLAASSSLAILAAGAPARADASAWAFIGGGTMVWRQTDTPGSMSTTSTLSNGTFLANGSMIIEAGVGTTPENKVIFGGLFRLQPVFAHGTDLAWLLRLCSHGYQAGDWGVAVDAGAYLRTWGPELGGGFSGGVSLGMPLGITLMLQTQVGVNKALALGAVAGIDLLRLTVYREGFAKWWQNPAPAWNRTGTASGAGLVF